jgi:archaellum component FlaC
MPPPAAADDSQMADHLSDSEDVQSFEQPDADLPPLPLSSDDDFLRPGPVHGDESEFMDRRMKRQLMDVESSFILDASMHPEAAHARTGADDTYLFGGSPGTVRPAPLDEESEHSAPEHEAQGSSHDDDSSEQSEQSEQSDSAPTPAGAYKTPGVHRFDADSTDGSADSGPSVLDPAPSSPAAEAAHRTQSRAVSLAGRSFTRQGETDNSRRPTSSASTVKAPDFAQIEEGSSTANERELGSFAMPPPTITTTGPKASKRPSFLANRHSSQRSSTSSFTNRSDVSGDVASLESLSADYALHAEGATPRSSRPGRHDAAMSRLPSLGSIASSMSGYSDSNPWDKYRSTSANSISGLLHPDGGLERLDEEVLSSSTTPPETPRYSGPRSSTLTDTVVARHVQDIHVPDTVAREFREKHAQSPEKRHSATPFTRSKHNLTLKEQNSKIDKLSKENFDLKLKIHFLDQALQNRSDEGVKEMISKNVQFQTDLATEKKESQSLRKKVRELERRLKAQEEGLAASKDPGSGSEDENTELPSKHAELEEEVEYLRESLETSEVTIEEWKQIALEKEAESRRMWEYIRSMKPATGDSASHEEALAMWQEDFQDEQALREEVEVRCEQAEAESERLREEMQRLKEQNHQLLQQSTASLHNSRVHTSSRLNHQSFNSRSNTDFDSNDQSRPGSNGGSSSTLVDQLQTSNERLQRDLHAQASMLTSRNRENLRLREENEGLKLTIRRGDVGSVTGDSILERSISRNYIRSTSRASGGTRVTQMSDPERDDIEGKNAALRDELSQLKLAYKELDDQLNGHLDMLETAESKLKELEREFEAQTEDLQALSNERDEALEILQDKEQECEELRSEALDEVERLQNQLDRKQQERDRILIDLENMTEDFNALQQEMKNVSESLLQLEDDRDASLRKIQNLESELDDANQELDRQDKLLTEERAKSEKLEIQVESCQGEVDFLREEQEGDKIKIGELESALNNAQITIQDDKEKIHDMEEHASEERQQRDALESQEKQEVEKIMNELNTQLAKLKEDGRKLRKNLSSKEVDATTWKQRHDELEASMREALDNPEGTRPSFVKVCSILLKSAGSILTIMSRKSTNCKRISTLWSKNSTSRRATLLRKTDCFVLATSCWRILAWRAVVLRIYSSASVKLVGRIKPLLKLLNVVINLSVGRFNSTKQESSSLRLFVARIAKGCTALRDSTRISCSSAIIFSTLCGIDLPRCVAQNGLATTLLSMARSYRWKPSQRASQASRTTWFLPSRRWKAFSVPSNSGCETWRRTLPATTKL